MKKTEGYRAIYGCPEHGTTKGSFRKLKKGDEDIPCFKCDACKRVYLELLSGKIEKTDKKADRSYEVWNTVGPYPVPNKVFIYDKQTEKGTCKCAGKFKKRTKNFTRFLMKDGTTKPISGVKACLSCNKVFITEGAYRAQSNLFEKYNIEVVSIKKDEPEDAQAIVKGAIKIDTDHKDINNVSVKSDQDSIDNDWENRIYDIDEPMVEENLESLAPASRVASAYYDADISFNPYQYLPWLKVFMNGSENLLISDEVGLGKTIEAGILIKEELDGNADSKILILCPAFLREKWYQELSEKFYLDSQIFDGKTVVDVMTQIVILPISRINQYLENMNIYDYSMVVIDEVHYFKNAKSVRYGYLRKMLDKIGKSKRIFMSATPINNSGNDYHSIEMLFGGKSDRTNTTKKQAYIYLPERKIEDVYVKLTEDEQKFYDTTDALDPFSGTIYRHIGASCLYALGRYAYSGDELTSETKEELQSALETLLDGRNMEEIETDCFKKIKTIATPKADSKIKKLKEILRSYNQGDKIVLFSHYIETVKYLHSELSKEFNVGYIYANTISNNMPCKNTKNKFLDAKNWFSIPNPKLTILICSDTCREGIDLDMAHVLINYDLPFNPSILEQRIGRIDRMSQKKDMYIYNFHVNDTYDDRLHFILSAKLRFINFYASYGIGNPLNITSDENHTFNSFIRYFRRAAEEANNFSVMSDDDYYVASRILRQIGVKIEKNSGISEKEMQKILIEKLIQNRVLIENWFDNSEIKKITEDQLVRQKEELEKLLNFPKNVNRHIKFDNSTLNNIVQKANKNPQFRKRIAILIKDYDKKLSDMEISGLPMVISNDDLRTEYSFDLGDSQSSIIELLRKEGAKVYEHN